MTNNPRRQLHCEIFFPEIEREVDQADHDRHLDQRPITAAKACAAS